MSLLNKKNVKQMSLDIAASKRKKPDGSPMFTRVSQEWFDELNSALVNMIHDKVHRHPSVGSTLKRTK